MDLSRIAGSVFSATQETTLALASLNFDFALIKYNAPESFQGVGSALTQRRRDAAEAGSAHATARKLDALFEQVIPKTPLLIEAYGKRASEISGSSKQVLTKDRGLFANYQGPDATTIWAAATSGTTTLALHLLACLLARMWNPTEAVSIWEEMVAARKRTLTAEAQSSKFLAASAFAAQIELATERLAEWDNSARAWLRYADRVMEEQQTKLNLVIDDLDLKVAVKATLTESVLETWTTAMLALEGFLQGVSQQVSSASVMLALCSWHLYPDLSCQGRAPVMQKDPLFPHGVAATLIWAKSSKSTSGVKWSLSLSHMRYYGGPVKSDKTLALDTSYLTIEQLAHVVVGSLSSAWGPDGTNITKVATVIKLLHERYSGHRNWLNMVAEAAKRYINSRGEQLTMNHKLMMLGRRSGSTLIAEKGDHTTAIFGLTDISTFVRALKTPALRVAYLRSFARRYLSGVDPSDMLIGYHIPKDYFMIQRDDSGADDLTKPSASTLGSELSSPQADQDSENMQGSRLIDPTEGFVTRGLSESATLNEVESLEDSVEHTAEAPSLVLTKDDTTIPTEETSIEDDTASSTQVPSIEIPSLEIDDTDTWSSQRDRRKGYESQGATEWTTALPVGVGTDKSAGITTGTKLQLYWTRRRDGIDKFWDVSEESALAPEPAFGWDRADLKDFNNIFHVQELKVATAHDVLTPLFHTQRPCHDNLVSMELFVGANERGAAGLWVRSHVLESLRKTWKAPRWAGSARLKDSVDIDVIIQALENDDLNLEGVFEDRSHDEEAYYQSLEALSAAWLIYRQFDDGALISPEIVLHPASNWKWPRSRETKLKLARAFACIALMENPTVDLPADSFAGVMALASGSSIYASSRLLEDPSANIDSTKVSRLDGNVGKPGLTLLVPPTNPQVPEVDPHTWHLIEHAPYHGQREDHFAETSLHLTFTEWTSSLDLGQAGRGKRQIEVQLAEAVVQIYDRGTWVGDVDILSALQKGSRQPDHQSFFRPHCSHSGVEYKPSQPGASSSGDLHEAVKPRGSGDDDNNDKQDGDRLTTSITSMSSEADENGPEIATIRSWVEFTTLPPMPSVVLAHKNWEAKLALVAMGVMKGYRVFLSDSGVCRDCLEELDRFGGDELTSKAVWVI